MEGRDFRTKGYCNRCREALEFKQLFRHGGKFYCYFCLIAARAQEGDAEAKKTLDFFRPSMAK
jgi:late competence protein required for DNA uptake (superfamily II DNA/RNA helicase)